jgi:two-component system response regulator (stage 0 sporulation protein F)
MNEGLRVLVVDDEWSMAKTLVDVLRLKGFRAEAACSGPQALEMMAGDPFDCVLTDIRMPDVNGVELLRAMRAMQSSVQVVLMSAYAAGDLIREGLGAGAIAGFVKPLDIDLLSWFLSKLGEQHSIVIADDDGRCWDKARADLEGRGFRVQKVHEPGGLLPALRPSGQVVFLGTGLNGVPGLELLKRIRERHGTLPVVLTMEGRERLSSEVDEARGLNVHEWLGKPVQIEELLGVLAQIRRRELSTSLRGRHDTLIGQMA